MSPAIIEVFPEFFSALVMVIGAVALSMRTAAEGKAANIEQDATFVKIAGKSFDTMLETQKQRDVMFNKMLELERELMSIQAHASELENEVTRLRAEVGALREELKAERVRADAAEMRVAELTKEIEELRKVDR